MFTLLRYDFYIEWHSLKQAWSQWYADKGGMDASVCKRLWVDSGTRNSSWTKTSKILGISCDLCHHHMVLDCCHHFHYHPTWCWFFFLTTTPHTLHNDGLLICMSRLWSFRLIIRPNIIITYTWQFTCHDFSRVFLILSKESHFLFFHLNRAALRTWGLANDKRYCSLFLSRFRGCYTLNTALLLTMKHTKLLLDLFANTHKTKVAQNKPFLTHVQHIPFPKSKINCIALCNMA